MEGSRTNLEGRGDDTDGNNKNDSSIGDDNKAALRFQMIRGDMGTKDLDHRIDDTLAPLSSSLSLSLSSSSSSPSLPLLQEREQALQCLLQLNAVLGCTKDDECNPDLLHQEITFPFQSSLLLLNQAAGTVPVRSVVFGSDRGRCCQNYDRPPTPRTKSILKFVSLMDDSTSGSSWSDRSLSSSSYSSSSSSSSNSSCSWAVSQRRVIFTNIAIREFNTVLSDHPSCSRGPPIQLGWEHTEGGFMSVDEYEILRDRERCTKRRQMLLSYRQRCSILIQQAGYTKQQIRDAMKEVTRIKNNRLWTDALMPIGFLQEAVEEFKHCVRCLVLRQCPLLPPTPPQHQQEQHHHHQQQQQPIYSTTTSTHSQILWL